MYWDEINKHMSSKFKNKETIEVLKKLPNQDKLENMADNKVYKVQFVSVAVDVINFKKMSKYTDPAIFSTIMSEFTYGITKILKHHGAKYVDVQGDAIFGTFGGNQKTDNDNVFACVCGLSAFKKHINKMIDKYFEGKIKIDNISWQSPDFSFGIGVFQGWKNYISKMGHGADRELVYMGESVNWASYLSDIAGRNNRGPILFNYAFKNNMTNERKKIIEQGGGFSLFYDRELNENVYECEWINTSYNNYVINNT